jgi:hypothetical protein
MRPLLLALALLGACADLTSTDPLAPAADPAFAERGVPQRLDELERQVAQLTTQLATAQATIADLERRTEPLEVVLDTIEESSATHDRQIAALQDGQTTLTRDVSLVTQEVSAIASDNPIFVANLGAMNNTLNNLQVVVDDQAGTIDALEDYALALAGGETGTPPDLTAALFESNPETGETVIRTDGATARILWRLRQRPEILMAEWDALLDESLTSLQDNPLSKVSQTDDAIDGLSRRLGDLAAHTQLQIEATVHLIDDWQGETGRLAATDDFLSGQIASLDTRVGANDRTVAVLGTSIAGTQADVDAVWAEMLRGDELLTGRVDALTAEVCLIGDLAQATFVGDVNAAEGAYGASLETSTCDETRGR